MKKEQSTNIKASVDEMKEAVVDNITDDLSSLVDERFKELEDRKRRETHLIFFNVPEKEGDDGEKRKKEDEKDIMDLASGLVMKNKVEIMSQFRLGRYINETIRPIQIILGSKHQRKYLLEHAKSISTKCKESLKR